MENRDLHKEFTEKVDQLTRRHRIEIINRTEKQRLHRIAVTTSDEDALVECIQYQTEACKKDDARMQQELDDLCKEYDIHVPPAAESSSSSAPP
jgi:hypothetical protein